MKRHLISSVIGLLISLAAFGQDIVGTWKLNAFNKSDDKAEAEMNCIVTYSKDGTSTTRLEMEILDKSDARTKIVVMRLKMTFSGRWSRTSNVIVEEYDPKSVNVTISDYPEEMPKMLIDVVRKKCTSEMKKQCKEPNRIEIISVTDNELKVKEADAEKAEVKTLKRVSASAR
ncbi:MAG: hypothetical protein MJY84_07095 [Bacteroidales bacterium]|nr:hypothetical protein [Bacteroidales bacterium]